MKIQETTTNVHCPIRGNAPAIGAKEGADCGKQISKAMSSIWHTPTQAQSHLEHSAELLDYAGNLIELTRERVLYSRQLTDYTQVEVVATSLGHIECSKRRISKSLLFVGKSPSL